MSVSAFVRCVDCDERPPSIGDGGAIGYPSAENSPRRSGELHSLAYLHEGFAAIGALPWDIEAMRAFLVLHSRHRISLSFEGASTEHGSDRPVNDLAPRHTFAFSTKGFVRGTYEVACSRCGVAHRVGPTPDLFRSLAGLVLTASRIRTFQNRVSHAAPENFYRVFGVLGDPGRVELGNFLRRHATHSPVARVVNEESWTRLQPRPQRAVGRQFRVRWSRQPPSGVQAMVDLVPPLQFSWRSEHACVGPSLVADERAVFGVESWVGPLTIHRLDADGRLVWRRSLGGFAATTPLCLLPASLVVASRATQRDPLYTVTALDTMSS